MRQDSVMETLRGVTDFDRLLGEPLALVYKHSTTCGISAGAHREVEKFLAAHPDATVYKVDVHDGRPVSTYIEKKTGVRHESPQFLIFRDGELVWHDSHGRVTAEAIAARVASNTSEAS